MDFGCIRILSCQYYLRPFVCVFFVQPYHYSLYPLYLHFDQRDPQAFGPADQPSILDDSWNFHSACHNAAGLCL